jgi:transketolase
MKENNLMNKTIPKDILGATLIDLAKENDKIVVLSSDVSISVNVECFHEAFPERFFEMGIAEQSTMSVSGGLAAESFIPVYVALAIFSAEMTFAQMRQVCNANRNVKIIGTHPGVDDGQDGSGHHATEDLAITRALPRMTVLTPGDENEVAAALKAAIAMNGPVYIRAARDPVPILHEKGIEFPIGKLEVLRDGGDEFAIVYEGCCQGESLEAYEKLTAMGRKGKLVAIRTLKPLDEEGLLRIARVVGRIITVENHSVIGGLFSAVAEMTARYALPIPVKSVAFADRFLESAPPYELKQKYGVSADAVIRCVLEN